MKKAIALIAAAVMILTLFSACGDKIITDKEGNTHKLVTQKGGEPAQDEYGNLIEEITNDKSEKVTQAISYPDVTQTGKNEIQDAYFIVDIPNDWYFDLEINKFRIQHDDESKKTSGAMCEISTEYSKTGDADKLYKDRLNNEKSLQVYQPDFVENIEEFETKLFGMDVKAYKSKYSSGSTVYFYVFAYAHAAVGIKAIIMDDCGNDGLDPEKFISEHFTLKKLG